MPSSALVNLRASATTHARKYHSSSEMFKKIQSLEKHCSVPLATEWVQDKKNNSNALFVARIGHHTASKKMMVAANEHAREMITGEVALRFIERACEPNSALSKMKNLQYVVLPNINVKGRMLVETGKHECQRMTTPDEGDTDINRNMDVDWGRGYIQKWGPTPFSTYQVRIMRDIAEAEKPLAYVDLHSGAKSLMTPWGFRPAVSTHYDEQRKPLGEVQRKHCPDCRMGSNRVVIGYPNPGEIIDHMYKQQGIKHSSLWEVFQGEGPHCSGFNPDESMLAETVDNWSDALVTYGQHVHDHLEHAKDRLNPSLIVMPQTSSLLDLGTGSSDEVFEATLTS